MFLTGPPGVGKTMLAQRLPGLLPDLTRPQALAVSGMHSLAGVLPSDRPLLRRPPFLDPHHTASAVSIVGGPITILVGGGLYVLLTWKHWWGDVFGWFGDLTPTTATLWCAVLAIACAAGSWAVLRRYRVG